MLTHCRGHNITLLELAAGCLFYEASRFDTQDSRELEAWTVSLTGEQLRSVEAECFDADQDPAVLRFWDWMLLMLVVGH